MEVECFCGGAMPRGPGWRSITAGPPLDMNTLQSCIGAMKSVHRITVRCPLAVGSHRCGCRTACSAVVAHVTSIKMDQNADEVVGRE